MKAVSGQVKGFGGLIQKNSARIKKMGRSMTVAGAAIVGGVGMMVKAFGNFDESMTRSLAIMGDVSKVMRDKMAKTAKQLSTETTFAAKELAEAYYFLASAGMNAEQSISALAPVARFAQAGAFDLAQATDLLTDAQTALGLSSKDVVENEKNLIRVSDVLVGANTLANASVLQFSESLTNKAAAALVNLNKEVEEGVAVLAAYADKGVKGRLAGNRLTMMLNGLFAATRENKKAWDAAGISLWEADGSMRSIADIIQDMEGYLGKMTVEQRTAELAVLGFNVKTKDSILTLMGSSEKIRGWTGDLKKMGGITKEVSDKQLEAFNAKMTVLGNIVKNTAITIGQLFVPMIEKAAKKIGKAAEKTSEWAEAHEDLAGVLATSVAVLSGTLLTLGGIGMLLPKVATGFNILAAAAKTALGTFGVGAILAMGLYKVFEKLKIGPLFNPEILDDQTIAYNRQREAIGLWSDFADKAVRAQIAGREELIAIWNKYEQNTLRAYAAIARGDEGERLRLFFAELIRGEKIFMSWATRIGIIFEAVRKKLAETTAAAAERLKDTIPVYDMWATTVGKIFHDTSVRAMEMRDKMKDIKLILPPIAMDLPKMSLEDWKKWYKQWLIDLQEKWKKEWEDMMWTVRTIVGQISGILSQLSTNQMQLIDNEEQRRTDALNSRNEKEKAALESWYEREREKIETTITNEEEKNEALAELAEAYAGKENDLAEAQAETQATLEADIEKKRRKAMRKQAIFGKAISLASAIINIAEAITKALTLGPFLGVAAATWVKVLGAIQIAAIVAAPLPALQKGGAIGGPAIVGEAGPELFVPERPGTIIPLRREATPISPPITRMRIIIQNKITVGEQTFYKETVKSVNKAGPLRAIVIPNEVVV